MADHTPGPWFNVNGEIVCGDQRQIVVATVYDDEQPEDEDRADGDLIAAAPDLLAACEAVLEFMDNGTPINPDALLVNEVRQAVAKAKGAN